MIVMMSSMNNLVGTASNCLTVAPPMATVRSVTEHSTIAVVMDTNVKGNNVAFSTMCGFLQPFVCYLCKGGSFNSLQYFENHDIDCCIEIKIR